MQEAHRLPLPTGPEGHFPHTWGKVKAPVSRSRFEVWTPVFEGPLELLLALTEREQIDILQVPLAQVTGAYLAELSQLQQLEPVEMAGFLWLAARLLLLKSVRLLPGEETEPEETDLLGWEEDVRQRLLEYRAYKEMAQDLMKRGESGQACFPAPSREVKVSGQEEPLRTGALVMAFQDLLRRLPPRPIVYTGRSWTMAEKLEVLEAHLSRGRFDLSQLILSAADRLEAVVIFVACLELLRRGAIRVDQPSRWGEIWLEPA
jgi:segregation and condensation protein A